MTLTAYLEPSSTVTIREGRVSSLDLVLQGYNGSVNYSYSFSAGTATSADAYAGAGSGAFSIWSSSLYTKTIPISFGAYVDRIDENSESFYVNVTLSGASFSNGSNTQRIEIIILDDFAVHGTDGRDAWIGTEGRDVYLGYAGNDEVVGNAGNDELDGGTDHDFVSGGSGEDVLVGGLGDDALNGGAHRDVLRGDDGNDLLSAGSGADFLDGGSGDDALTGGLQADVFQFHGVFGHDRIADFDVSGRDKIDLSDAADIVGFRNLIRNYATDTEAGVLIWFSEGASILVENVNLDAMSWQDFIF